MTPELAWQATLDQLQMEIPKPTFNKWVRDARFVTYEEGVMTLGFQNCYTRDWVEARLNSMIRRILAGILAQDVSLKFEVIPPAHSLDEIPDEENHLLEDMEGDLEDDNEEVLIQMDMARQSVYEAMVQPERVAVIPGYFLRWIPYLGHQRSWMIVALWQIFFQNCGHKVKPGKPFSASGTDIARWSGLSRRTVVTYLNTLAAQNSDNYFRWFIERVDMEFPETHNGQATRFRFKATMPLTPGDAHALNTVLGSLGIVEKPIAALKTALTYQPKELLPFPAQIPSKDQTTDCPFPTSVQQLVLKLTAITPKHPQYVEILQLASELAGRLMPPKDVLVLSHYFLLNWLPLLGSGPGWLITFLRDEGFYDRKTGELRDKIKVDSGYTQLAKSLGLDRENTIGDWLPNPIKRSGPVGISDRKRQDRRDMVRGYTNLFLAKTNFRIDYTGEKKTSWEFHLKMTEPLIPEHQQIHDGLLEVLRQGLLKKDRTTLAWLLDGQDPSSVSRTDFDKEKGDHHADCTSGEKASTRIAQKIPRVLHTQLSDQHALFTGSPRELHNASNTSPRALHTLKHLINQHFSKARESFQEVLTTTYESSTNIETTQAAGTELPGREFWDYERLLALDGTHEKRRREICKKIAIRPTLGPQFLGWLLYAYYHRKTETRKAGIESPFGYALSRYEKLLPPSEYISLANHSPDELRGLLLHIHNAWGLPKFTQNILRTLAQNGLIELLDDLRETQICEKV